MALTHRESGCYLSKAQEEQLLVAIVDETRQNLLIGAACDQPLVRPVSFPDTAIVGDVFALGVDAVHLKISEPSG